jgi:hypothetical protein
MPTPVLSQAFAVDTLQHAGFSDGIVRWVATNLWPIAGGPNAVSGMSCSIDSTVFVARTKSPHPPPPWRTVPEQQPAQCSELCKKLTP